MAEEAEHEYFATLASKKQKDGTSQAGSGTVTVTHSAFL